MATRARGLQRLADVYGMVERMRSVDLRVASDAVREAADAADAHGSVRREQSAHGRCALEQGDRLGWVLAESQEVLAESRQARVEQLRLARETERQRALEAYQLSRLEMEQMQQLVKGVREREEKLEQKLLQAAMDDRHLSRVLWAPADEPVEGTDGADKKILPAPRNA